MKFPVFGVLILLVSLLMPDSIQAATLYITPNSTEINRGDVITLSVRLDTDDDECVNTIDATIRYSDNIEPIDTSRGGSIMSVWLEEPSIDKVNKTITFAGGIPNGYCGRITGDPRLTNNIVELVFSSPGLMIGSTDSGNIAKIEFGDETRVLLNDGFGTDAPLVLFGSEITLAKNFGSTVSNDWSGRVSDDLTPPKEFSIELEKSTNAFNNRYFIVFNTTDKESGIDYYEVIEESLDAGNFFGWGAEDAPWARVKSPYVLKDQSLNSTIRVRAYDKAGNEYIATLVPDESKRTVSTSNLIVFAAVATTLIVLIAVAVVLIVGRKRKRLAVKEKELEAGINYE